MSLPESMRGSETSGSSVHRQMMNKRGALILGDVLVVAIITLLGFSAHGELGFASLPRMLTTFLPLLIGWFLVAPWLGLFDLPKLHSNILWRIPFAMLLAAPLATVLRAASLNETVIPLFTLILGGSTAIGLVVWRGFWIWLSSPAHPFNFLNRRN